jgi:putative transposase
MIDRKHDLSITRQAEVLQISRGSVYYLPRPVPDADLAIMRCLDRLHMEYPFAGSRMLRGLLALQGCKIGRRHVKTLMRRTGIEALYRRPRTTKPEPGHKIYPYLLRGMEITRPNQVWAMDITYIPMARGFVYLAVVLDWATRRVLSWRLSITMEAAFCVETLEDAMARHGKPEIFNTDQGSQFTGAAFTGVLADNGIAISMDGKGAWRDNVFVERLWRSVKYEEVYLRAYETVGEARASIGRYLDFYNRASEHPSDYVFEEKRFCWSGCDPAGYFGFCRARSVMDCAADVVNADRSKIQGPSDSGWIPSISPASAASRSVLGATFRSLAALPRLSHGSMPSTAALNTGMR